MENTEQKTNWAKIIAIGCGGCAFFSCLGVLGFVAVFNEEIIELGEAVESMDNLSVPIDILALPDGGSTEWDAQVKAILVTHFDKDQSGLINTVEEVEAIECDVWNAINLSFLSSGDYQANFTVVYGFEPDLTWLGEDIGFGESMRPVVLARAPLCFSVTAEELMAEDSIEVPTEMDSPSLIFDPNNFTFGDTAQAILNLPNGGSDEWDNQVRGILLAKYDRTGDGSIDVSGELNVIGCDVWAAIDIGMRAGGTYGSSAYAVYGFEPSLSWLGNALGISNGMRTEAYAKVLTCHQSQ